VFVFLGCVLDSNYMDFWFTVGLFADSCSWWWGITDMLLHILHIIFITMWRMC